MLGSSVQFLKTMVSLSRVIVRTSDAQHISALIGGIACVFMQVVITTVVFVVRSRFSDYDVCGWDFLSRHKEVFRCTPTEAKFSPLSEIFILFTEIWYLLLKAPTFCGAVLVFVVYVLHPAASKPDAQQTVLDVFFKRKCLSLPQALLTISNSGYIMVITNSSTYSPTPKQEKNTSFSRYSRSKAGHKIPHHFSHRQLDRVICDSCAHCHCQCACYHSLREFLIRNLPMGELIFKQWRF